MPDFPQGSLERDYNVSVRIDWPGLGQLGLFDTFEGGLADSEETKYTPGGSTKALVFGGRPTIDNVTVARYWSNARDRPLLAALYAARGKAPCFITKQPVDANKTPVGSPIVYPGRVKSVKDPDSGGESNDVAMLTIEQSTEEPVA